MNEHYAAVLADMGERRAKLQAELAKLDAAIVAIQQLAGVQMAQAPAAPTVFVSNPLPTSVMKPKTVVAKPQVRFANISVRWGVLWYLAEDAPGHVKTGEISNALLAGGYQTSA
jgi:hypothetical protein